MFQAAVIIAAFLLAAAIAATADRMRWTALPEAGLRIGCIDGLRGYLALGVMIHHFTIWLGVLQGLPWQAPSIHVWAALIGGAALVVETIVFPASFAFGPCILLAVFFVPVVAGNSYFGLFSARPSIVLGEASYGIYLLHGIVLYLALADAKPLMDAAGPVPFWATLPLLFALVVAAAILLHEFLEKPAISVGRLLARSWFARRKSTQSI